MNSRNGKNSMSLQEQAEFERDLAIWQKDIEDAKRYLIKHNAEDLIPMLCSNIDIPIKELPKPIMEKF